MHWVYGEEVNKRLGCKNVRYYEDNDIEIKPVQLYLIISGPI